MGLLHGFISDTTDTIDYICIRVRLSLYTISIQLMSRIYLIIFPITLAYVHGASRIIACICAVYALLEVVFAGYYVYRTKQVQSLPVGTNIPNEGRDALVHKILGMDLSSIRKGNSSSSTREADHAAMNNMGSDLTLADENGFGHNIDEKQSLNSSNQQTKQSESAEKVGQDTIISDESAVEFRERLRTW